MDGLVTPVRRVLRFERAFKSANYTTAGTPAAPADRLTLPTGIAGVFSTGFGGSSSTWFVPYGTANNGTFVLWVYGWNLIQESTLPGQVQQWHATLLAKLAGVLGSQTGVAGGIVDNSVSYADTISDPTVGNKNVDVWLRTNADDKGVAIEVDNAGCPYLQVIPELGTATAMNVLVRGN